MAARRQALRLAARALEQRLNGDSSDHGGAKLPCPCGGSAQYHGRHGKRFESALGPLHLRRAYYHCKQCESGFCPRDRALGLESFSLTPGVRRMTGRAAALLSFEESSGLLQELAGVEVSAKQVERAAEALGAEIAVDEHQQVEKMGEVAPTMYLGMDGTGVPMRSAEAANRAGKQADGSAKTREAKLVTLWTAESRDEQSKPVRDPGSVTYSAAMESAATLDTSPELSEFAARVQREASRRGFTEAQCQAVLGDGSAWIWNTATELFPQATQILDRFHAQEHLSQLGKVIYGDSPEGKQWIFRNYIAKNLADTFDTATPGTVGISTAAEGTRPFWARSLRKTLSPMKTLTSPLAPLLRARLTSISTICWEATSESPMFALTTIPAA